jgi:hypothetical protein
MIEWIHRLEKSRPKQHPVGMTFQFSGGKNSTLFESPAEWISPNPEGGYRDDPPPCEGKKVILTDTDHLWGIGGSAEWAWKSFLRGLNPLFMDPYDGTVLGDPDRAGFEELRRALGQTREWAEKVALLNMVPRPDLASTRYCLANPGAEYLVYNPPKGSTELTVVLEAGEYEVVWYRPRSAQVVEGGDLKAAKGERTIKTPFEGEALLYLVR